MGKGRGEADYTFIKIMGCLGCVNGGGQPHVGSQVKNFIDNKLNEQGLPADRITSRGLMIQ